MGMLIACILSIQTVTGCTSQKRTKPTNFQLKILDENVGRLKLD